MPPKKGKENGNSAGPLITVEENRFLVWGALTLLGACVFLGLGWISSEKATLVANDAKAQEAIDKVNGDVADLEAHEGDDKAAFSAVNSDIFIICHAISTECLPIPGTDPTQKVSIGNN